MQNDGKEVCSALHDVVRRYGLTYNPNLCQDGVRGVMDPHGLVVVTACGTLHNAATCCGTFHQVRKKKERKEGGRRPHSRPFIVLAGCVQFSPSVDLQQFGLVRDPFDCNSWKIKFTNARLISRWRKNQSTRLPAEHPY